MYQVPELTAGKVAFLGDKTWTHFRDMSVTTLSISEIHLYGIPNATPALSLSWDTGCAPEMVPEGLCGGPWMCGCMVACSCEEPCPMVCSQLCCVPSLLQPPGHCSILVSTGVRRAEVGAGSGSRHLPTAN